MDDKGIKRPGCCHNKLWDIMFVVAQVLMIIMYICVCTFEDEMRSHGSTELEVEIDNLKAVEVIRASYSMWMDVHVMIFIGFGFLMVFLKTHCWSSIGINYICAAWCIQCGILFQGFWHRALVHGFHDKINVNLLAIIEGEFCAAAFLITMGALLGKATFAQLFFIATFESVFFTLNAIILFQLLKVVDIGGAMTIHMFGAYFGLSATYFFEPAKALNDKSGRAAGGYNSQLIAMVGTVFLFMYWPSFNGILGVGMAQTRAVVNTVISISASCISSVIVSRFLDERKINIEVLLNATLAGGVMMGAAADLIVHPGWTMLAGALCGAISALGFLKLNKYCQTYLKLHDTCGVQFLHGIPGTLGSITAGICTAAAMSNFENDAQLMQIYPNYPDRPMNVQTGMQFAGIAVTWAISIPAGAFIGFCASRLPMPATQFDDTVTFSECEFHDDMAKFEHHEVKAADSARPSEAAKPAEAEMSKQN